MPPAHQEEEKEVQNIVTENRREQKHTVAVRTRLHRGKKMMSGFPKYLFTPSCVLAFIEAVVDQISI